jgi:hypothetical protein
MITYHARYVGQLGLVASQLFAVTANATERIVKAVACNDTTTDVTCTFHRFISGGAVDPANMVINARTLGTKETIQLWELEGMVMGPGYELHGLASADTQVTVHVDTIKVV